MLLSGSTTLVKGEITHAVPQAAASCKFANSSTRIRRRLTFIPISLARVISESLVILGNMAELRGVRYSKVRSLRCRSFALLTVDRLAVVSAEP